MDRPVTRLKGKRVALITNIPRPYRSPLYETLNHSIEAAGGAFKVLFYSDPQRHRRRGQPQPLADRYPSASVAGPEFRLGYERVLSLPLPLLPALRAYDPDAVISGSFGPVGYLAWLYTQARRCPYIQWSGATCAVQDGAKTPTRFSQSWLARRARASVTYGTAARDYLVALGAAADTVIVGVNTVDTAWFAQQAGEARARAAELKASVGLDGVHLLYVGSLIERKGLGCVLDALAHLPSATPFYLHVVGDGPGNATFQARARTLGLGNLVYFWGAHPSDQLPLYYALADVFLFPSLEEVWGLVLNEAMACGLPVIASALAGATRDLAQDGVNGFVVDPRDTASLAKAIGRLVDDAGLRARQGEAARTTIHQRATIEHSAAAFLRALDLACA